MRQKFAQLLQVAQGENWFPVIGLVFISVLLLVIVFGPDSFLGLGLVGQRKEEQISLAAENTCPKIPQEEFGKKPDQEKAKVVAPQLDQVTRDLSKKLKELEDQQNPLGAVTVKEIPTPTETSTPNLSPESTDQFEATATPLINSTIQPTVTAEPSSEAESKEDASRAKIKELEELVKSRKKLLVATMRQDPDAALASLLSQKERLELLAATDNCLEKEETLEGTLEVTHADFFDDNTSQTQYTLITQDNQRIIIHPARGLKDPLESRTRVRIRGFLIDDDLVFDGTSSLDKPSAEGSGIDVISQPGNPPVLGDQKTIVILANFADTPQPSLTRAQAQDAVFNSTNSYYQENSYNLVSLSGTVVGWYRLSINRTCDPSPVETAVAAADPDVYFPDYTRLIIIVPYELSCDALGYGTIGKISVSTADGPVSMSIAWISSSAVYDSLIGHELGHNFGNHHARFLNCGNVSIATTGCDYDEYGDLYDIMGFAGTRGHFNAPHKEYVGWLSPLNIQTVTESGRFVLEPIETPSNNLKALKIARNTFEYLYVEYRQPIGFDTNFSAILETDIFDGALLHICTNQYTCLIDTTPLTDDNTAVIKPGNTFIDPATETKITVVSATADALTVEVVLAQTDFTGPTTTITAPIQNTTVSGAVEITADATDPSGVARVDFFNADSLIGSDDSKPYSIIWNTTHVPNGIVSLSARAYDIWGNFSDTSLVRLTVANSDSSVPSVVMASPSDGATINSPTILTMSAEATDNVGIWRVEFYMTRPLPISIPIATDTQAPYSHSLNIPAGDGSLTFQAKAYDFVGNSAMSSDVTIRVVTNQPPTIQLIDPDVNNDAAVNTLDIGTVVSVYGSFAGQANFNPNYDLNSDGRIDISDIGLVNSFFGTFNWPPANAQDKPISLSYNKLWQFYLSATDPDGTLPTISATKLPAGATLTEDVVTISGKQIKRARFAWTPKASQRGKTYKIDFKADDGACNTNCPTKSLFVKVP